MINFPPVGAGIGAGINSFTRLNSDNSKKVVAPNVIVLGDDHPPLDRRRMGDRRRRGSKWIMERRLERDRRRSIIDITV